MNYDAFERTVLGYGQRMSCRSERRRLLHPASPGRKVSAARPGRPVRFQLAVALRSLADHLDTGSAHLA